ncbi:hypothetical protein GGX14DRAFT_555341 [Mycena pura]|uniref:Uncharacterized protein n=1 Tax=Mycena pura TaxID=153505 RepID=A0AAD7E3J8_9AGAR|nr:hypothetical protein GGX14DRAFT_555341 [Mycena pura]
MSHASLADGLVQWIWNWRSCCSPVCQGRVHCRTHLAGPESLKTLANSIKTEGESADEIVAAFSAYCLSPEYALTFAVFNVGHGVLKSFLQVTPEDVRES